MSSARTAISQGSKSFYLASILFTEPVRRNVWTLYRWCRYCDDQVDLSTHPDSARVAVDAVRSQTINALRGDSGDPVFSELGKMCREFNIQPVYPLELIEGFAKDAQLVSFHTLSDVEEYSYQVAGVVGVMMTSLMGSQSPRAIDHAVAMGKAMQLTNIARDVAEDFHRGRVYLPSEWLAAERLPTAELMSLEHRPALFRVVLKLLKRSDELYLEGFEGLRYLPWRSAIAVAAAAEIYSYIGIKIRRGGQTALDRRVYVNFPEKLFLTAKGLLKALRSRL